MAKYLLLTHQRGVASRYEKLAVRYDATVPISMIGIWLRRLERPL